MRWKENLSDKDDWLSPQEAKTGHEARPTGTITCLGLNPAGELSGAEASIINSVSIPRVRLEGHDPQSVAAALGDAMEQAGIPTNGVTLGLGGEDSILRYNHVPPQASAKLPLIMKYEVESVSERMGEAVASDFKQLPAIRDDGERTVLLGLAREEALTETLEALEISICPRNVRDPRDLDTLGLAWDS